MCHKGITKTVRTSKSSKKRVKSLPILRTILWISRPYHWTRCLQPADDNERRDHKSSDLLCQNNSKPQHRDQGEKGTTYNWATKANPYCELHLIFDSHPNTCNLYHCICLHAEVQFWWPLKEIDTLMHECTTNGIRMRPMKGFGIEYFWAISSMEPMTDKKNRMVTKSIH